MEGWSDLLRGLEGREPIGVQAEGGLVERLLDRGGRRARLERAAGAHARREVELAKGVESLRHAGGGGVGPRKGSRKAVGRQSVASSGLQWPSVAISGLQWPPVAISGHQWPSVAISGNHLQHAEKVLALGPIGDAGGR